MPEQLSIFHGLREGISFANFYSPPDGEIIELIKGHIVETEHPCIYLWGKDGVGKSHLLQAACAYADSVGRTAAYLPLTQSENLAVEMLQGLENLQLICVDDVHAVTSRKEWQLGLFHLFNRARDNAVPVIFAAQGKPADLGLELPDLVSRMAWGPVIHVKELSDKEKIQALQLRARQRGFLLPTEVGRYLLQRIPRDMHSLFALLERLDETSLAQQRKLTIPFVREII